MAEWGTIPEVPIAVEIPRVEEHGDFSTNAALQLAKPLGRKPRDVAGELVGAIRESDDRGWFRQLTVAGPGFINIDLSDDAWREVLATALEKGERFGALDLGRGETV